MNTGTQAPPRSTTITPDDYAFFQKNGYLVFPDAITPDELTAMVTVFDHDFKTHNYLWRPFGMGQIINCDALASSPAVDLAIRHPRIFPVIQDLMGGPICFSEICLRLMPPSDSDKRPGWHRDKPHWPEHPLRMDYIQLMIYLTDVSERSHCFTMSPESHDDPILESSQEQLVRSPAVHFYGKAGTAVVFNISAFHTATCRKTDIERKSIQIYYGHQDRAVLSNDSFVPAALWRTHPDPATRAFYGKINEKTRMFLSGCESATGL